MRDMRKFLFPFRRVPWNLLVNTIFSWTIVPESKRYLLLRLVGIDAERCAIAGGYFLANSRLTIGKGSFINRGVFIDSHSPVTLGSGVYVGPQVTFATSTHRVGPSTQRAGEFYREPITVGDGVWIGARATILPGVKIGEGSIIAAGSVVTKDCDPNSLYGGVPAAFLKTID